MSKRKIFLILTCIVVFHIAFFFSFESMSLKSWLYNFAAFLFGLHLIYGYLFDVEISMGPGSLKPDADPNIRLMVFIIGIILMCFILWYMVSQ